MIRREQIEVWHGDVRLCAEAAWDDALNEPRPGVVVFHEGGGLGAHPKQRAERLAELGFVALAWDMYGSGEFTQNAERRSALMNGLLGQPDTLRARALLAVDTLARDPKVAGDRLAAIGYCFGGHVALEAARMGAALRGVVSFHGLLDTKRPAEPGAVRSKLLVCHGLEDPLVPFDQLTRFLSEMRSVSADLQLVAFANASHGFTNKNASFAAIPGVTYEPRADARSWTAMRAFFDEIFAS